MGKQLVLWMMLMGALVSVCAAQGRTDTADLVRRASKMSDTMQFEQVVDSLESIAPRQADAYGQLALIYWHRAKANKSDSWQATWDAFKMCTYHHLGRRADSVALYAYYDSRIPPMGATMREATSAEQMRKLAKGVEARLQRMTDELEQATNEFMRSLQKTFKGQ